MVNGNDQVVCKCFAIVWGISLSESGSNIGVPPTLVAISW